MYLGGVGSWFGGGELRRVGEELCKLYQKTQCSENSIAKYNAVESSALKLG